MTKIKLSSDKAFSLSASVAMLLSLMPYPVELKIQNVSINTSAQAKTVFFATSSRKQNKNEDSDLGRPRRRVSGKGRNPCSDILIALVPGSGNVDPEIKCNVKSNADLAYTSDPKPTFWIHVPKSKTRDARFVLIDNNRSIAKYFCKLPEKFESGVVGFQLPVSKLEAGNVYQWEFSILNNRKHPTENPTAGGKISLDLQANNPWYNRITSLANQRLKADSPSLKSQWSNLLSPVGLNKVGDFPLVGQCTPQ
ncbi:MAG: DUF928 domain-containing protein [Richelia sp. SL_2_1]|nr:DUF928 domain-containing protein [Richelia sp. SM1_7_0]NJN11258.1 DUF928 domain-containing protein [Richelia sp. RM1_1_1]NJO27260.1 DUF928 domain-containing protein [Richelia sp. SL_2_1]